MPAAPDFELLWRNVPSLLVVLDANPAFTILDASDAYLRLVHESREEIVGRGFFDVFPESDGGPGTPGVASSRPALERVLATRMGDGFNAPIADAQGTVRYILHRLDALDTVRRLERANEELGGFAQSASEGLRAPLRAIESYCRLFEKMRAGSLDDGMRKLLARITTQVNRMDTIIEGLLGLSRSARTAMTRQRVDITSLARRIGEEHQAREPARHVAFTVQEGLEAWADGSLLAMALDQLIGNAWKFTRERKDARVDVGAAEDAGQVLFHVRDNGVGFDMAQGDKLFSPFARLHGANGFEGHGLGLATVRRIVERHGGEIGADAHPGDGATFFFTLGRPAR
jgi:Bacteriophytochrome (light-regulated signal transduction histidine kinase)